MAFFPQKLGLTPCAKILGALSSSVPWKSPRSYAVTVPLGSTVRFFAAKVSQSVAFCIRSTDNTSTSYADRLDRTKAAPFKALWQEQHLLVASIPPVRASLEES